MERKDFILVIDDDPSTREILELILRNAGYKVEVHSDAHVSLDMKNLPSVILLDNNLGTKTGSELCQELKDAAHTKHIPVILISAMNDIDSIANDVCADDYLAKPFSMQSLIEKINKVSGKEG